MSHISLHCTECSRSHAADVRTLSCDSCGSPLVVHYLDADSASAFPQPPHWDGPAIPMPMHIAAAIVSIGEGNTPIVHLPELGKELGLYALYAKLEFLNPTGSFKDRGTSVMMSMLREHGVNEVVEDSSGNAGASVSAYAARAGIYAHIFAPGTAPEAKLQQIKVYGANAHSIEGPREAATDAAVEYYTSRQLAYASHNISPYFIEGTKVFAYELHRQLGDALPDHIVMPVGNGSLFIGSWTGFTELIDSGAASAMPKHHVVQSTAVMPIVAAHNGENWQQTPGVGTIAGGIAVGSPPRLKQVLNVLRSTGGAAVAVDDDEIVKWQKMLSQREGIYGEPTSAAAFAGLRLLVEQRLINEGESVLVPITGFGLKDAPPT